MTDQDLLQACERLFLFPLSTMVLFPNTVLPLHVFEPRYRALTRDCLATTQCLAIPLLAPGWEKDYEGRPRVHPVAGMGRIVQHEELEDGRFVVVLRGIARVRIDGELNSSEPYRLAKCQPLEIPKARSARSANQVLERLRLLFGQYLVVHSDLVGERGDDGEFVIGPSPEIRRLLEGSTHPVVYCDLIGHLVLKGPEDRQRFLETDALEERVEQLIAAIAFDLSRGEIEA